MFEVMFRPLNADEIDIRIDRVTQKGVWLLLYKNARVDMAILDETVGAMNWQRKHRVVNDNLYCAVEIYDEAKDEWVSKEDVGVESWAAKEKGEASDSLKRAGTCWGIGRELYTAPDIFIYAKTKPNDKGKGYLLANKFEFDDVYVSHIKTEDEKIKELAIANKKGDIIFSNMGRPVVPIDPSLKEADVDMNMPITKAHLEQLKDRLERMEFDEKRILKGYKLKKLSDMTIAQLADCNMHLSKLEEKEERKRKEEAENIANRKINDIEIEALLAETERVGLKKDEAAKLYEVDDLSKMTFKMWKKAMDRLSIMPELKEPEYKLDL